MKRFFDEYGYMTISGMVVFILVFVVLALIVGVLVTNLVNVKISENRKMVIDSRFNDLFIFENGLTLVSHDFNSSYGSFTFVCYNELTEQYQFCTPIENKDNKNE